LAVALACAAKAVNDQANSISIIASMTTTTAMKISA
jgi:hypothetical protein